jgi:membrane protease YdiL (CAAX protease family)
MNRKQLLAIGAAPFLAVSMAVVYRVLARLLGDRRAWYVGFVVYWVGWCLVFPVKVLGRQQFRRLFVPRRPGKSGGLIMGLVPGISLLGRFFQEKRPRRPGENSRLVMTAFLNGTLEEVLWRGVYTHLFPEQPFWSIIWPTLWFALWHYGPGSISPMTDARVLMGGAAVLGLNLAWLTRQAGSIVPAAITHTLAGLAQIMNTSRKAPADF